MSRSAESDICKNVLWVGDPQLIIDQIQDIYENENGDMPYDFLCGWKFDTTISRSGQNGYLYSNRIIKDQFCVEIVNTHEHSNGGGAWYAVYSDDRSSVEEFKKDFDMIINFVEILDLSSVSQTL